MIGRNFPSSEVAERSLEQYSTAVLEHTLAPPPLPKAEFRVAMQAGEKSRNERDEFFPIGEAYHLRSTWKWKITIF